MILRASHVVDLQHFLMDVEKRYAPVLGANPERASGLLSGAAALDYLLLLASEHGDEALDDQAPVVAVVRETLARAARAALDFVESAAALPNEAFADFSARYLGGGGIFGTLGALRTDGALDDVDVEFRSVTLRNDALERAARGA